MIDITDKEINALRAFIKTKVNQNTLFFLDDIVQDLIIEKSKLEECYSNFYTILNRYNSPILHQNYAKKHQENVCIKCNEVKPVMVFRTYESQNKTYLGNVCNDCIKEQSLEYYYENKEKCYSSVKNYRKNNPEKRREIDREYYKNNPEYFKKKREKQKEYIKEYGKRRYELKKMEINKHKVSKHL